jgi:hypothetical protein
MSTEHNRKCNRVDRRMRRARQLLESYANGNRDRDRVLAEIGGNARLLSAVIVGAHDAWATPHRHYAALDICERIARERTP